MTMLWVMLTIMTSAAAVIVAIPFLRRMDKRRDELREIEIYRNQLCEVEKNVAAGLIDPTEAEAAALEIKRRLLAANHTGETGTSALTPAQRRYAVIAITGFVVVGSTILYTVTGSPELASGDAVRGMMATGGEGALPPRQPPVQGQMQAQTAPQIITARAETQQQGGAPNNNLGSVDDMIERVQRRVEKNPADVDGWRMLGWSYLRTDRPQQAVDAYSKAVALKADDAELQSAYADALIKASGTITEAAKGLVDKALQLNPNDPQARYIKGMIQVEAGDRQGAIETWVALLSDIDQSAETAADLRERLTNLAKEAGVDITARLPQQNAETPPTDGHDGLAPLKPLVQGQAELAREI